MPFGKRATCYSGVANLRDILRSEINAKHIESAGFANGSKTVTDEELEAGEIGTGGGKTLFTGNFGSSIQVLC